MNEELYKGVLIDQSVDDPEKLLRMTKIVSTRPAVLEGESFRGVVLFHNIEVEQRYLQDILREVSRSIKSPGWYFHLVNSERLYVVMPKKVLSASNNDKDIQKIVDYGTRNGIHPEQLDLKKLFKDPYA